MRLVRSIKLKAVLVSAMVVGLMSCQSNKDGGEGVGFAREETIYMAGIQWGEPNTFNPLSDWPAFPVGGNYNLMYEPLVVFNSLSGETEPLLAELHEQTNDLISVKMNPAAKWSDGTPLTANDVLFTFNLGKKYSNSPTGYVWDFISDVVVDTIVDGEDSAQVEQVKFIVNKEDRNNPLGVMDLLQAIRIVPEHVFSKKLASYDGSFSELQKEKVDKNPVVSGPYNLLNYSNQKIVLKRRDDYWGNEALHDGKMPKPQYLIHPIYKSNDAFSTSLQNGNLDVSSTFIPRIWMKAKNGVKTWYSKEPYFVPATIPMMMINCTKEPLSDPAFRRAMAFAINYQDIRELAVSGYSPELKGGLILPFGIEKEYYSEEDVEKYGAYYDLEKAKKTLADAGYKSVFVNGELSHMENSKGEKLPSLEIKLPAGWTDWESMVSIAVKGMREAGIDARKGAVDAALYWQAMPSGNFDLLMHKPSPTVTPSKPWSRFESVMSSRNWQPVGERMNENQGRYNNPDADNYNPAVDSLMNLIPTLTDEQERKAAYRELNKIFMQEQVSLPLAYLPEQFYEFSVKHWENFPTEENPYAPPQVPCFGVGTNILWEISSTH
ncbi:MAG: ABC transporter substrate-binding protein [Fibrobacterota bacterium]